MSLASAAAAALAGALAGSLANGAIDRVRAQTARASHGGTSAPLSPDHSPERSTPTPIILDGTPVQRPDTGARRVLVVLATALLFVVITSRLAALDLLPAAPAYLAFTGIGVALTVIDIDCKRLPNFLVLPSYPVVFLCLTAASAILDDWTALARAAIGAAALFGFYLLLALIHPAGMGFGDVKLAGVLGAVLAFLSYGTLLAGAVLAFVMAAIVGVVVLATRRGRLGTTIPFGPYMIAAALVAIIATDPLARAYLDWAGVA